MPAAAITPESLAAEAATWANLPTVTPHLATCARATFAYVDRLPHIDRQTIEDSGGGEPLTTWADTTLLGAVMLTARLERRRNSAAGIEAITDVGVSYVARHDSDIARLLHIEDYAPAQIG